MPFPYCSTSTVLETYEILCKKQRESTAKSTHGPTAENTAPPKPPKQVNFIDWCNGFYYCCSVGS
jgi:hypothetical protein